MVLIIEDPEAERLAHLLADATGESLAEAVTAALPVLDSRSPDEILGYDEYGLPR